MKCGNIRLEEFLAGRLTEAEASKASAHLKECLDCRERFRIMMILESRGRIGENRGIRFRNSSWRYRLPAAAGVFLAFLITLILLQNTILVPTPDVRDLATPDPYPLILLSTRAEGEREISKGLLLYREGRYREALEALNQEEENEDNLFFSGICHYMLDQPVMALERLRRSTSSSKWSDASRWYQSQALLQMGRGNEARALLTEIAARPNRYQEQAESLLGKIQPE